MLPWRRAHYPPDVTWNATRPQSMGLQPVEGGGGGGHNLPATAERRTAGLQDRLVPTAATTRAVTHALVDTPQQTPTSSPTPHQSPAPHQSLAPPQQLSRRATRELGTDIPHSQDFDVCHFDAEYAFLQSKLDDDISMQLPKGCGDMSGMIVKLHRSIQLKAIVEYNHLVSHVKNRALEEGYVSIVAVVHVVDLFAVGKNRCGLFCEDLSRLVPINNFGELPW